ncbi:hypothetical protein K1T71_006632 [Dendrolimus kikuchii]|uniref:Uncharacterized protein n=1 Tax=Dendrolimus kikuchii TaxID=765133 RepID=A0ACC1D204_9NEOP|nr:hypothetical protein K1T71_006632 [Dendrolimus kikuchii]
MLLCRLFFLNINYVIRSCFNHIENSITACPAWEEERLVLGATIENDLSLPAVVQAMVGGQPEWDAVASFCEAVMSAKEAAERERERAAVLLSRRNNRLNSILISQASKSW